MRINCGHVERFRLLFLGVSSVSAVNLKLKISIAVTRLTITNLTIVNEESGVSILSMQLNTSETISDSAECNV